MNFKSFLYRLKRLILHLLRNPLAFLKIFNLKKVFKAFYQLSNVQVPFNYLKKDYQTNVLLNTLEKIDYISDKNLINKKFLINETKIEELEKKYLNDENHSEYEAQGYTIERIKENIKNKSIDYNHEAKQDSVDRFSSSKLQKINKELLPSYIKKNFEKYKMWFD